MNKIVLTCKLLCGENDLYLCQQIAGLPKGVKGACFHSNMTKVQRDKVMSALTDGVLHFLLVSPETIAGGGGGFSHGNHINPNKLPPVAFVCIDEAHCLSEWSHHFRPSYLRLCKVCIIG